MCALIFIFVCRKNFLGVSFAIWLFKSLIISTLLSFRIHCRSYIADASFNALPSMSRANNLSFANLSNLYDCTSVSYGIRNSRPDQMSEKQTQNPKK